MTCPSTPADLLRHAASLHDQGQFDAAMDIYEKAMTDCSAIPFFWNNRANTLLEKGRFPEAAESYRKAIALDGSLDDSRVALATVLQSLNMIDEAMEQCNTVISRSPGHAEAHWNRALLLLLRGDYTEGWKEYEWRWRKRAFTSFRRNFMQPRWNGEDINGKRILVHAEQGFGDTIQFCRYLTPLIEMGASVIFECHKPLVKICSSIDSRITSVAFGSDLPEFHYQIPLLSLPGVFATEPETIPNTVPYLKPPEDLINYWKTVLPPDGQHRTGICWAGRSYPDPRRSIPSELLNHFLGINTSWISLQAGDSVPSPPPLPLFDLSGLILDFADTAAIISLLDIVVTIDTSVAHLSGALGKNTLLLLPAAPDWRWMLGRSDSPWYPTLTIIRQDESASWESALLKASSILKKFSASESP